MKNVILQAAVCSSVVAMASQLFSTTLTDYVVSADETRTVASGETLTIERLLKGVEPHSFTLGGAGNSCLYGPSTFNGVFTYTNDPKVNGSLYVYGDEPFGPASEINLYFKDATGGGGGAGAFHLGGTTISQPIHYWGGKANNFTLHADKYTQNLIKGAFELDSDSLGGLMLFWHESRTVFAGGFSLNNIAMRVRVCEGAELVFTNAPVIGTGSIRSYQGDGGAIVFQVPSNRVHLGVSTAPILNPVRVETDDFVDPEYLTSQVNTFGADGVLDLCGHSNSFGHLGLRAITSGVINTSDTAVTMRIRQTSAEYMAGTFGGRINLEIECAGNTTAKRWVTFTNAVSTAEGDLTLVDNDQSIGLAFENDAAWPNVKKLNVPSKGVVRVINGDTFGDGSAHFVFDSGAGFEFTGNCVTQTVATLKIGPEVMQPGLYGADAADGVVACSAIRGPGFLKVLHSRVLEGEVIVGAGETLVVDSATYARELTGITVEASGTIDIKDGESIVPGLVPVSFADETGRLVLEEGVEIKLASLTVGGENPCARGGRFGAGDLPILSGAGTLFVDPVHLENPVDVSWTAGAMSTRVTEPQNWTPVQPDFTEGSAVATFGVPNAEATFSAFQRLNGAKVTASGVVLSEDDESAMMVLGERGFAVDAASLQVNVPVWIADNQTWTINNDFTFNGALHGDRLSAYDLLVKGNGATLTANGNGGDFPGRVAISNLSVVVSGENPFGTGGVADSEIEFFADNDRVVNLSDCHLTKPLYFHATGSNTRNLTVVQQTTNTLAGKVTIASAGFRIRLNFASELKVTGGFEVLGNRIVRVELGGWGKQSPTFRSPDLVFTDTPISVEGRFSANSEAASGCDGYTGRIVLAVPSNYVYRIGYDQQPWAKGILTLACKDALDPLRPPVDSTFADYGGVDVCGNTHLIGSLTMLSETSFITNSSSVQGGVIVNQIADQVIPGRIGGATDLTKIGAKTLTLSDTAVSATGTIRVLEGALAFSGVASWLGATNVVVSGTSSRLVLVSRTTLGKNASWSISDGGKVSLGDGVQQRVGSLEIGGVKMPSGTYGATGSGAEYVRDDVFEGSGRIRVGGSGLVFLVR